MKRGWQNLLLKLCGFIANMSTTKNLSTVGEFYLTGNSTSQFFRLTPSIKIVKLTRCQHAPNFRQKKSNHIFVVISEILLKPNSWFRKPFSSLRNGKLIFWSNKKSSYFKSISSFLWTFWHIFFFQCSLPSARLQYGILSIAKKGRKLNFSLFFTSFSTQNYLPGINFAVVFFLSETSCSLIFGFAHSFICLFL